MKQYGERVASFKRFLLAKCESVLCESVEFMCACISTAASCRDELFCGGF